MTNSIFDTDQKILSHLSQGDVNAFDFLYQKYFSKLYGAVYKRLQNRELTEEIVQELFIPNSTRNENPYYHSFQTHK